MLMLVNTGSILSPKVGPLCESRMWRVAVMSIPKRRVLIAVRTRQAANCGSSPSLPLSISLLTSLSSRYDNMQPCSIDNRGAI
ncbi:unnamed protein product [Hydatigera taeniaeformis]|uniref:Secreted protein n=1 Tax=Hydatigena taeniaeformis TaxID=6205 RepID=A0A0R3XCH2_HYDTA|nr:unnamed protein product [Hydatigera taeniaeformis]